MSSIPILKYLFGSKDHTITDNELVFLVVPHVVRTQNIDRANLRQIDTGAGSTTIDLRHVPTDGATATPAPSDLPASSAGRPRIHHAPRTACSAAQRRRGSRPKRNGRSSGGAGAIERVCGCKWPASDCGSRSTHPNMPPGATGPVPAKTVSLSFNPPAGPVAVGTTFQVPIVVTDGTDVSSVAVQVKYDPAKLSLVNVSPGDYLIHDGQSASPVHSDDDGTGSVNVVAARPPGTPGVAGTGVVYSLSFQAKARGRDRPRDDPFGDGE